MAARTTRVEGKEVQSVFSKRLPSEMAAELLEHMSEEESFAQTLSQFPNMSLEDLRETFAWLATEIRKNVQEDEGDGEVEIKSVAQCANDHRISPVTKKVLTQLSPEMSRALLRNFGALD